MWLLLTLLAGAYVFRAALLKFIIGWTVLAVMAWAFSDTAWESDMRAAIDTSARIGFAVVPGDGFPQARVEIDNPTGYAITALKIACPVTGADGIEYHAFAGGFDAPEVLPRSRRTIAMPFNIHDFEATANRFRAEACAVSYEPADVASERRPGWVSSHSG